MDLQHLNINEKLNAVFTSRYITIDEKNRLLLMKKRYLTFLKMKNIKEAENKLYNNRSDREKVDFEISRIEYTLQKKDNTQEIDKIKRDLRYVKNIFANAKKDTSYGNLFAILIVMEEELKMDIGLFEEYIDFFEKEVDVMYSQMVWREMEKDFEETEALEGVIEEK